MGNTFLDRIEYVDGIIKLARANMVFGKLFNTRYSGNVQHNKSIKIEKLPRIRTRNHVPGADIVYDDVETGNLTMLIDQAKDIALIIEDLEAYQNNPNLRAELMQQLAYSIKKDVEEYLASVAGGVSASNIRNASSPLSLATDNKTYTEIAELVQLLRDAGYGDSPINVIVPPLVTKRLGIDTKFLEANQGITTAGVSPIIRILGAMVYEAPFDAKIFTPDDTKVGTVDNASGYGVWATTIAVDTGHALEVGYAKVVDTNEIIYISAVDTTSITIERAKNGSVNLRIEDGATIKNCDLKYAIKAGCPDHFGTYASGLNKIKTGQSEKRIGDYIQALNVYAAKIITPDAGAISYVTD
jgi:hypothetical protein